MACYLLVLSYPPKKPNVNNNVLCSCGIISDLNFYKFVGDLLLSCVTAVCQICIVSAVTRLHLPIICSLYNFAFLLIRVFRYNMIDMIYQFLL